MRAIWAAKSAWPMVQQGFPEKPLLREPDRPIPVAVHAVVAGGFIDRAQTDRRPQVFRRCQLLEDALFLVRGRRPRRRTGWLRPGPCCNFARPGDRRRPSGSPSALWQHVAEIPGLFIPGTAVERADPGVDVRLVLGHVAGFAQRPSGHLQDLGDANAVRRADHRGDGGLQPVLVDIYLRRIVVPAAGVVEIIPGLQQARLHAPGGRAAQRDRQKSGNTGAGAGKNIPAGRGPGCGSTARGTGNAASAPCCRGAERPPAGRRAGWCTRSGSPPPAPGPARAAPAR